LKKINIAFGIHNHQPVGNFDFVFEDAYEKAYLPFLELLERHPHIRMAKHYTGILFEWIKEHKPEFIPCLRKLVERGQIEMMTGGFYEPIMSVIPYRDKIGQIEKLTEFVKSETGYDPGGMWLAERIWEPHLPKPCAEAGVKYLVLDDSHFKNSGLREDELCGYFITEEEGKSVYLFPIAEKLRYTIPFQPPEDTIEYLQSIATEDAQTLVVFADDGEKFGVWPGTYEHCYEDGWLESFFKILEKNSDWINIVHLSEALETIRPLGRIYLPTSAYREMMEWAMPTRAIHEYEAFEEFLKKKEQHDQYKVFVRGGFWRNFLAKYPESNNMHKKMLHLSQRLQKLEAKHADKDEFQKARTHVWAGQCNCPYWHGIFGGLYLNHLRYATYHEFIQAERLIDTLERGSEQQQEGWLDTQKFDFDADGYQEVLLSNPSVNLYFSLRNGGSLYELDFKPAGVNLLDTMTRREESYHKKLKELDENSEKKNEDNQNDSVASIHDLVVTKEKGLQNMLFYDWYRRTSMLDHFLRPDTKLKDFAHSQYTEAGDFVNQPFISDVAKEDGEVHLRLSRVGQVEQNGQPNRLNVAKEITLARQGAEIRIEYRVRNLEEKKLSLWFGIEFGFALLAGDAPDRNYIFPGHPLEDSRLRSTGVVENTDEVQLKDEWLKLLVSLKSATPATFWRFPIETISQSEGGFERVYQSSVVFPNWKLELQAGEEWRNQLVMKITEI